MNKLSAILFISLLIGISGNTMAANYKIDPAHANGRFAIDHFGTSTNTGGFYNLTGQIEYNPKRKDGKVTIVIPMDTVVTGNDEFNTHLKGKDFFDVEKYPTATFVSTRWHFDSNKSNNLKVTHIDGNLTLHGKTNPIRLTATKFNCYLSPVLKKQVCGGDFTTTIDRTKWGIDKYVMLGMTKEVRLDIQIEAAKQ